MITQTYEAVELGGGNSPRVRPNIDIFKALNVDIVADLSKGIPLPEGCTKKIYSYDFIEHLTFLDFLALLRECRRILIQGGVIEFETPDMDKILVTHNEYNNHVHHCVVGEWDEKRPELRHKSWWTPSLITYVLRHEGWTDIEVSEFRNDADYWKEPKMVIKAEK